MTITHTSMDYSIRSTAFQRTLIRSILYPIVLLVVLVAVFLWQLNFILRTTARVEHSNVVITQASVVLRLVVDMETGLRGYLLTDDSLFLEPYRQAEIVIDMNIGRLHDLIIDDSEQSQRFSETGIVIKNWRQYATSALASKVNGQTLQTTDVQITGKQMMDSIRQQLADFMDVENHERMERILGTQTASQLVILIVVISGFAVGGLLAIFSRQRLVQLSQTYEQSLLTSFQKTEEILTQREWLRGVLSSIGEAVIATDIHGNITFINQITEQLTGWTAVEATGKPLDRIYKVNPDETISTPNPPDSLADQNSPPSTHTSKQLTTRDSKVISIEDNITSIKDVYGKQIGTVLVFRDVTRRRLVEQERLRLIKTQAQYASVLHRSNEQLRQFAFVASHDLQEPIRMIISYLQLLEQRFASSLDQDAHDFIGFAVDGAKRMKELITDLLAYARLDTDEPVRYGPTSMQTTLDKTLADLSSSIAESGATITHDELPQLQADASQMMQLLQNLISNALKFHSDQPLLIHVGAQKVKDEWQFSVQDNGIGIAPEYQERIFGMFQRLHPHSDYPGTGIGLAICKKIVERHHGRIWVKSAEGQGTTMYFSIPPQSKTSTANLLSI